MTAYVIAASKDWFSKHPKSEDFKKLKIFEVSDKNELNLEFLRAVKPRYIFFPHWNWKVDASIYEEYECIVFHTAPLPFGRGGSPIQNLIIKGFKTSPVCALQMTSVLDGGPIYDREEVSLAGNISEIFQRIAVCIEKLILHICQHNPKPVAQAGEIVNFQRLTFKNNELLCSQSMNEIYDRIRMVDGEDYPKAYIRFGSYRIEFSRAKLDETELVAEARLIKDAH